MNSKHFTASDDPLRIALNWLEAGEAVALATVVETWGSAPRPAGSQLVCDAQGRFVGSVSGGCVEVAVIQAAQLVLQTGSAQLLSFGVSDEQAWSVGLACGGQIRIFVERLDASARQHILEPLLALRDAHQAAVLVTPLSGATARLLEASALPRESGELAQAARQALTQDRACRVQIQGEDLLLTPFNPALRLLIVGAVHIAEALSQLAQLCGYAVTVVDPRSSFVREGLFAGATLLAQWPQEAIPALRPDARTAVVLLTHDPKIDDPALECVREAPVFYIGALGSVRTHSKRLERLAGNGWTPAQLARIHGPAGLAIGARTPAEIAVSVLAQLTQSLRQALA